MEAVAQKKNTRQKIENFLQKIPDPLRKFFYSDAFFIVLSAIAISAWITGKPIIGFIGIMVVSTVMLVVLDDVTPGIPMVLFAMTSISSNDISGQLKYIPVFIPTILALIFHIIVYKGRWKLGTMFAPQIAVTVAMLVGGCTCIALDRYLGALGYTVFLGVGVLVIYEVFLQYSKKNPYGKMTDYFAKFLFYVGLVIVAEIIVYYIRLDLPIEKWINHRVDLGWSISTNISTMLLLTMPMCFYRANRSKFPAVFILLGVVQYGANVMTLSRGGILFGFVTLLISLLYLFFSQKNKKRMFWNYIIVLILLGVAYGFFFDKVNTLFQTLLSRGTGTSGRDQLYLEAWESFKKYPVFGVGMGYDGPNYTMDVIQFYWFHSTFFQILGSTGSVGLAAFGFFYFVRYKQVLSYTKFDKNIWFIFFAMLGFELYSLIDTGTFIPVPFMAVMIWINMVLEIEFKPKAVRTVRR